MKCRNCDHDNLHDPKLSACDFTLLLVSFMALALFSIGLVYTGEYIEKYWGEGWSVVFFVLGLVGMHATALYNRKRKAHEDPIPGTPVQTDGKV